jgi:hypothetical protein
MEESPIEITLTVQLVLTIDPSEQYPLAAISEVLAKQNITSILVEALVECLNERLVENFCGEKHAHGNGNRRFQRSATCTRSAVTTAGEHTFTLDYVEDTFASQDEQSHFRPVENYIQFDGKKRYQEDISSKAVDLATTLSYRDAASAGDGFEKTPSPDTIQRRVKEYGKKLSAFVSDHVSGIETDTVIPDGTKCHSQDDDRSQHEVQITLAEDDDGESRSVLDVSVNADWNDVAAELDEQDVITDDAAVVSDGERCLVTAFTEETREHQRDLVHVPRSLRHRLSVDGALDLETRKGIISEVNGELYHLKNSVEKHRPEEEYSAIRDRIARTRERIEKTTWQLEQFGSEKAAAYLRRGLPSMLTFAKKALDGVEVRWTSNPVERAMGEVAKRCKRDWMQWSQVGLNAVLQLRLVKYQDPELYSQFFDEVLCRSTHEQIHCTVSVDATGGEV